VTGAGDCKVRLWAMASGECIGELVGRSGSAHTEDITSVAFSPDGQAIASGSFDQRAKLWDAESRECLIILGWGAGSTRTGDIGKVKMTESAGHKDHVYDVTFSPDCKTVLTASADETAKLWDFRTGRCIRTLQGHRDLVNAAAFSPCGRLAATASDDRTARLWDLRGAGSCIQTFAGHTKEVRSVTFSPDGHTVLTASADKSAALWDVSTGERLRELCEHDQGVASSCFLSLHGTALGAAAA